MSDPAKPFDAWRDALIDAHDAASTIAMRALAMQRAFLAGDFSGGVEAQRVVTEKLFLAQQDFLNAAIAAAGTGAVNDEVTPATPPAPAVKKAAMQAKRTRAAPKATKKAAPKSTPAGKKTKTRRQTTAKRK